MSTGDSFRPSATNPTSRSHPEREGGFSVCAEELPGAVSQGNTIEEATRNITEALTGIVQTYLERGSEIPWDKAIRERPKGAIVRWVDVNA